MYICLEFFFFLIGKHQENILEKRDEPKVYERYTKAKPKKGKKDYTSP